MCNETFEGWSQLRIFEFLAECGYQGVEIAPFTIDTDVRRVDANRRAELRRCAEAAGVEVVGLHWLLAKTQGLHLTSPDPKTRQRTAEYLAELARFSSDLGGRAIIFGSPRQRNLAEGISRDEGMDYAAAVFQEVIPVLEQTQVTLCLEPLGPTTTNFLVSAADAVELAQRIDSPWCRLILDCKAMQREERSIPELIRWARPWLAHFHANDFNRRGPGMGDLDFQPILAALREIDYAGWVSVEVFDLTPGAERIARDSIGYLRDVTKRLAS
jgi:sugar phosphate isomerase/epimerase